jgi:hypothetical protein
MIIPKKTFGLLAILLLGTGLIRFSRTVGHSLAEYCFGPYGTVIPYTIHIVLSQFKEGTSAFAIKEVNISYHPDVQEPRLCVRSLCSFLG